MFITNIQRFSVDDGPGIRTTAFLAGCNLRCAWCHNPEAISPEPGLAYYAERCMHCGRCAQACENGAHCIKEGRHILLRQQCTGCKACIPVCPAHALELSCAAYALPELLQILLRDKPFYSGGGGVTFSGGEPMLQPGELLQAVNMCKSEKVHVAIDTAAHVPAAVFEPFYKTVDLFLVDCKAISKSIHMRGTGVINKLILENIKQITGHAKEVWVRVPVIPGYNATIAEMKNIAAFLDGLKVGKIELLPYHAMGAAKYTAFGIKQRMPAEKPPGKEEMNAYLQCFLDKRLPALHKA